MLKIRRNPKKSGKTDIPSKSPKTPKNKEDARFIYRHPLHSS